MKKVKISAKGRVCKFRHCKQVLSVYNHEQYCHVHLLILCQGGVHENLKHGK